LSYANNATAQPGFQGVEQVEARHRESTAHRDFHSSLNGSLEGLRRAVGLDKRDELAAVSMIDQIKLYGYVSRLGGCARPATPARTDIVGSAARTDSDGLGEAGSAPRDVRAGRWARNLASTTARETKIGRHAALTCMPGPTGPDSSVGG
jgi:hypothetical protein